MISASENHRIFWRKKGLRRRNRFMCGTVLSVKKLLDVTVQNIARLAVAIQNLLYIHELRLQNHHLVTTGEAL